MKRPRQTILYLWKRAGSGNVCSTKLTGEMACVLINKSYEKIPRGLSIVLSGCCRVCSILSKISRLTAVVYIIFAAGCIPLNYISHNRIAELRDELSQLHICYKELQQSEADLYTKFNSAHADWNASIQDLQNKVAALDQKMRDLAAADKQSKENGDEFISPSSLYGRAYGDYLAGKYDLAYSGFQSFIDKYPGDEQISKAKFYMGECFKMSNKNMSLQ